MSRLRRFFERRSAPDGYGSVGSESWDFGMVWRGGGGYVSVERAQQLSAVFAAQRILTDAVATLPIHTYRKVGGVRVSHPDPPWLQFVPPVDTQVAVMTMGMLSMLCDGNAFFATPRDALGVPTRLVPLDPDAIEVRRDEGSDEIYFEALGRRWSRYDVLHIPGLIMPGRLRGMSPLAYAREVIKGAKSAQEFGTGYFENFGVPPAVIEIPPIPAGSGTAHRSASNPEDADRIRANEIAKTWRENHGGANNAGKVAVLMGGAKLSTISVSPEDMQWMEARQFGVQEIGRFYGVPSHMMNDASNSTSWGSGLAEQNVGFAQYTLRPYVVRFEQAFRWLLHTHGEGEAFTRIEMDALLQGTTKERYEAHAVGIKSHFLTINEARALEDLPPVEWGDRPPVFNPAVTDVLEAQGLPKESEEDEE